MTSVCVDSGSQSRPVSMSTLDSFWVPSNVRAHCGVNRSKASDIGLASTSTTNHSRHTTASVELTLVSSADWTFHPNLTTLRSGLCYCKSVCLSVVCLSVCNVRAPYSKSWNFRQNLFSVLCLSHPLRYNTTVLTHAAAAAAAAVAAATTTTPNTELHLMNRDAISS